MLRKLPVFCLMWVRLMTVLVTVLRLDGYYRRILNMESLLMKSAKGNPHMKMFLIIIKHYMHMDKEAEEEFNILYEKHKADVDSMTWNRYSEVLKVDRICHYVVRRIQ